MRAPRRAAPGPRKTGGAEALGEEDLGEPQDRRLTPAPAGFDVTAVGAQPAAFALQVHGLGLACGGNAAHLDLGGEGLVTAEADGGIAHRCRVGADEVRPHDGAVAFASWVQRPSFPTGA